jgi:DNA repair protein RadC
MKIADLPDYTKPSSKIMKKGAPSLDTDELLSIIFGIGTLGESALEVSRRLLKKYDLNKFEELGFNELVSEVKGKRKKAITYDYVKVGAHVDSIAVGLGVFSEDLKINLRLQNQ